MLGFMFTGCWNDRVTRRKRVQKWNAIILEEDANVFSNSVTKEYA